MNRFQIVFTTFLALAILSCDEIETNVNTLIYGKWRAIDLISADSQAYQKKDGFSPIIEFKEDGTYILNLDMNGCFGGYTLLDSKGISISAAGCTKMCCDSEFSQKFLQLLPQVNSYQIEKNKLKLEVQGWGWISLELHD